VNDIFEGVDFVLEVFIIHWRNHKHLSVVLKVVQLLILDPQDDPQQSSASFNKRENQILDFERFAEVYFVFVEFEIVFKQKDDPYVPHNEVCKNRKDVEPSRVQHLVFSS